MSLQKAFHVKEQAVILQKKQQYENFKATLEMQQKKLAKAKLASNYLSGKEDKNGLEVEILKNITDADSLLDLLLVRRHGQSDSDSTQSVEVCDWDEKSVDETDCGTASNIVGTKKPKDDKTVIEELRTLNKQLHDLIDKLLHELHARSNETDLLKERIRILEQKEQHNLEHIKQTDNNQVDNSVTDKDNVPNAVIESQTDNLKLMSDSSIGDVMSPYVISPCSELSPELGKMRQLPTLAPLELPDFDFNSLRSAPKDDCNNGYQLLPK
ncbi:uncharacterized protein LOC113373002 isoform X2 [Ctenocephalides felis]|nr:uncharacterized protein LOC113373002 isoform X2 [Ctenocephalides felis]